MSKKRNIQLVICLDEFQNVDYFDSPFVFQKKLHAHWQHHTHPTNCLYGSKRHMMTELFKEKSMPFYKFGDMMFLEKIPDTYWVPFITAGLKKTGKRIDENLATRIGQERK